MDPPRRRSRGVTPALLTASAPPGAAQEAGSLPFEALYRTCRDDVLAYVGSLLRDPSAAEDVTSQAFERAYRRRRTYSPRRGTQRAWLFGIARNAALDELRRRQRAAPLPEEPAAAANTAEEETRVERLTLRDALAELPARERDLVALKFLGGLSNAELARVLGVSESNAGTLLHRTVTKLRKACHAPQ